MDEPIKGTVTSLASVFAPEDAQKASVHVQEVITERQKEVQQLQVFLNDNTNLVNLVKKLPDQLHHDIMVPFGKAAFFPGRLIHTNELTVLLGEGYYAERTSKQTVEILKRRGKDLESQIETLNAVIKDLKFEASFFDETATEAAEGIVEIREDYVDEASNEDKTAAAGEDDFARILSRIDELEKEELESEIAEGKEEEEEEEEEDEDKEEAEEIEEADISQLISSMTIKPEVRNSEPKESPDIPVLKDSHIKVPTLSGSNASVRFVEHNKLESLPRAPVSRNEVSTSASKSSNDSSKKSAPVSKEVSKFGSSSSNSTNMAFTRSIVERTPNVENSQKGQTSAPASRYTGSIVEHTHNIGNSQKGQTSAPASKPVSRFKLQRK